MGRWWEGGMTAFSSEVPWGENGICCFVLKQSISNLLFVTQNIQEYNMETCKCIIFYCCPQVWNTKAKGQNAAQQKSLGIFKITHKFLPQLHVKAFVWILPQSWSRHFVHTLNLHSNLMSFMLMTPFYSWRYWDFRAMVLNQGLFYPTGDIWQCLVVTTWVCVIQLTSSKPRPGMLLSNLKCTAWLLTTEILQPITSIVLRPRRLSLENPKQLMAKMPQDDIWAAFLLIHCPNY